MDALMFDKERDGAGIRVGVLKDILEKIPKDTILRSYEESSMIALSAESPEGKHLGYIMIERLINEGD